VRAGKRDRWIDRGETKARAFMTYHPARSFHAVLLLVTSRCHTGNQGQPEITRNSPALWNTWSQGSFHKPKQ
jgi:hypothetical protein